MAGRLAGWRVRSAGRVGAGMVAVATAAAGLVVGSGAPASATIWTTACPSTACPYTAPTTTEAGFAADVLARLNLERAQPQRDYPLNGRTVTLPALAEDPALQQTAQAFAEHLAATETLQDYSGEFPGGELATGGNAGGPGFDSAGEDLSVMESPGHAAAVLSAASDFAGIGVACDAQGHAWEVELFGDANQTTASAGQTRLQAELAANSVYAQSGGTITTVAEPAADGGGTDDARYVYPTDPIAAGSTFATGVDWTCQGPVHAPGAVPVSPLPAPVTGIAASPDGGGYALVDGAGAISVHGDATFHGGANGLALAAPIAHIVPTPDGGGYWLVAADGGVFAFGDAGFFGSMGGRPLDAPVVDLAPTPDGGGYWLVAADGGVFAFGDAGFFGSMGGRPLNRPVVGMVADPSGGGYWLVASDGGIFAFGDAVFHGSTGAITLNRPIVAMAADPATGGYWLVASDGGIFAFDASFLGAD